MKKHLLPFAVLLFFFVLPLQAEFQWRTGETLTYKVKYSFVRLGTVRLMILDSTQIDSIPVHRIRFNIDSSPLLFFVNVHSVFDCYLDNQMRPIKYIANETEKGKKKIATYHFNYPDSFFTIDMNDETHTTDFTHKVLPLKQNVYDGISLVFYSRSQIHQKRTEKVLAFWEDRVGKITLNFKGPHDPIKIGALEKEMPVYYIDGMFHLKGIAGVTGPFQGWFARDEQRPPLRAYLKVFIGNVVVELEKWERWNGYKKYMK